MGIPLPPPWVLLSLTIAFTKNIQDVKDIGSLGWSIVRGRGDHAGCALCDKLVGVVLKQVELDDMSEGDMVDCESICFKIGRCIRTCEKITNAMANSTGFPCIAAGLCPAVDEFGEVSCEWDYKRMGCEPSHSCVYKFPKCELKPGIKKWKQVSRLVSDNIGQFSDNLRHRKRCSEPDAGPFCIQEATGIGVMAEWGGLVLTFVGGAICSVHAIETPGGDDDRQWLTFWIIMMCFFLAERFTDVLLSRVPRYYEAKFCLIWWLMFYQGADKIYRLARTSLKRLSRALPWLFPERKQLTEEEYIETLPKPMRRAAYKYGLERLMSAIRCDHDITRRFGPTVTMQVRALSVPAGLELAWRKVLDHGPETAVD